MLIYQEIFIYQNSYLLSQRYYTKILPCSLYFSTLIFYEPFPKFSAAEVSQPA